MKLNKSTTISATDFFFFFLALLSVFFIADGSLLFLLSCAYRWWKRFTKVWTPFIWYSINFNSLFSLFSSILFYFFLVIFVSIRSRSSDFIANIAIIRQSYLAISSDICEFTKRIEGEFINAISATTLAIILWVYFYYLWFKRALNCNNYFCIKENLRKHVLHSAKHQGRFMYECTFCDDEDENTQFKCNYLKEYQQHLKSVHNISKKIA